MSRVLLRPTIPPDLSAVIGEPLPYRIRALTVEIDGKVMGIGGLGFPPDEPVVAFVQAAPEAKRYPVTFHRAGLAAMAMIREANLPTVVATTSADFQAGIRWLKRLGFREAAPECQDIPGKIIFCWSREEEETKKAER
jgi:RimJ/RimL family protein N-acetyltransferase